MGDPAVTTALKDCRCDQPIPFAREERADTCVCCGYHISPDWTSNTRTLDAFLRGVEAAVFDDDPVTNRDIWEAFRAHIEARELSGRPRFGNSFLSRDNIREGQEEAADLAMYACLDSLCEIRRNGKDDDTDLALTAAQKAYEAYEALAHLRHRRQGGV